MLHYSEDLRLAHRMKEWFYDICQMEAYRQQQREFDDWIANAQSCGIKEFEACAKTYRAWRKEILNAFKYGLTNGKRKVLGWIAPYHKFLHNEHS